MAGPPDYERLTIYLGESDQWQGRPLWQALLELMQRERLAGATVLRGLAGFGAHSRIKTATLVRLSADLPLLVIVVDRREKIEAVLPQVSAMVDEGLITREPMEVVKYGHRHLPRFPRSRRVSEAMTRDPTAVRPATSLAEVARLLLGGRFTAVPVVDDLGYLVGIVADGDFLRWPELALTFRHPGALASEESERLLAALAQGRHTVADIMTAPAVSVGAGRSLAEAAHLMALRDVKSLPVVDESGLLVGIISRSDILREIAAEPPSEAPPTVIPGALHSLGDLGRVDVPRVAPEDPLPLVVEAMSRFDLGRVVVTDGAGHPLGVVSDGDLVARVSPEVRGGVVQALLDRVGLGGDVELPAELTAADLMTAPPLTAPAGAELATGLQLLAQEGRHSLVLVDGEGRLAGLLDRRALLRALLGRIIRS